jgi:hypothetical protein
LEWIQKQQAIRRSNQDKSSKEDEHEEECYPPHNRLSWLGRERRNMEITGRKSHPIECYNYDS